MRFVIRCEQKDDDRYVATAPAFPGATASADSPEEAGFKIVPVVLRMLADQFERSEIKRNHALAVAQMFVDEDDLETQLLTMGGAAEVQGGMLVST